MLSEILHFLASWRWIGVHQEPLSAIDGCIAAVESYFPCSPSATNSDIQCLCEQYLWRDFCFSSHEVDFSSAFGHHNITTQDMEDYCKAAGSVHAEMMKRNLERDRRQVTSVLSSIAATATLRSNSTVILTTATAAPPPVAVPTSALAPVSSARPVLVSSAVVAVTSAAMVSIAPSTPTFAVVQSTVMVLEPSSIALVATPKSDGVLPVTGATTSAPRASTDAHASSTPTPSPHNGPSVGLIAGAVIGSIAVLLLAGILVVLILRYKKKNQSSSSGAESGEHGGGDKEVYNGAGQSGMHGGNEMATNANVWELEGHVPPPSELEAANGYGVKEPKRAYLYRNS